VTAEADTPLAPLSRDLARAENARFDVIVVGGGIHGACLLYEASRRGLSGLLVEQGDFGGATSWNSMRILHGGFRYLQSLDLPRYIESVRARRWFLRMFPGMVEPLSCVMPLYGEGLKRPMAFRAGVMMNRMLIGFEGRQPGELKLHAGAVLSPSDVVQDWQQVQTTGLRGGGMWADARMLCPERYLVHLLRIAAGRGSMALNYVRAESLVTESNSVRGIEAVDTETTRSLRFSGDLVINAAGPQCRLLSEKFAALRPELFMPVRAFNLVLNRAPVSESAMAISTRRAGAQTYFMVPWGDRLVVGTPQIACEAGDLDPRPTKVNVEAFLAELNEAALGLEASLGDVHSVWSGLVPAEFAGATATSDRARIVEHGRDGGPEGLISVSGVKYTTAPMLARKVIERIPGPPMAPFPDMPNWSGDHDIPGYGGNLARLGAIARDESVVHADDLVFRRTGLWQDSEGGMEAIGSIASSLGWDGERIEAERIRLEGSLRTLARPWDRDGAGD